MSTVDTPSLWSRIKGLLFHLFPHHWVSRGTYRLTRQPGRVKNPLARLFVWFFKVDMSEAIETDPCAYPTFNAFFTRPLKAGARPLPADGKALVSPADGRVSQAGRITHGEILQAKGHSFSVTELLGGDAALAAPFLNGHFMTVYLSPRDYHRVHLPADGRLRSMVYVPGRLFSVAPYAVSVIPRLFARNERMAAIFDSPQGAFAVVMVGAVNVAAIETVWAGLVTPPHRATVKRFDYHERRLAYRRGDEMGRFNMGSTVIVLCEAGMAELDPALVPQTPLRMGQAIGLCREKPLAATG